MFVLAFVELFNTLTLLAPPADDAAYRALGWIPETGHNVLLPLFFPSFVQLLRFLRLHVQGQWGDRSVYFHVHS